MRSVIHSPELHAFGQIRDPPTKQNSWPFHVLNFFKQYMPFEFWTQTPLRRLDRLPENIVRKEAIAGSKIRLLTVAKEGISPGSFAIFVSHAISLIAVLTTYFLTPMKSVDLNNSDLKNNLAINILVVGTTSLAWSYIANVIFAQFFLRPLVTGFPGTQLLNQQSKAIQEYQRTKSANTTSSSLLTLGYTKRIDDMWNAFLCQFDRNSLMISYNWAEKDLPRSLCPLFPNEICWLDIHNLLPGTAVTETCAHAAQQAIFRFVFLSNNYLKSRNCRTEFDIIRREPHKCFIFAYDAAYQNEPNSKLELVDQIEIDKLRSEGFFVFELSKLQQSNGITKRIFQHSEISRKFLLEQFVHTRCILELFKHRSPPVNACWLHTAIRLADLFPTRSSQTQACFSVVLVVKYIFVTLPIVVVLSTQRSNHQLLSTVGPLIACVGILELLLTSYMFLCIFTAIDCNRKLSQLSDPSLLLVVLRKLDLIAPIQVFVNDYSVMRRKLELLREYDVIHLYDIDAKTNVNRFLEEDHHIMHNAMTSPMVLLPMAPQAISLTYNSNQVPSYHPQQYFDPHINAQQLEQQKQHLMHDMPTSQNQQPGTSATTTTSTHPSSIQSSHPNPPLPLQQSRFFILNVDQASNFPPAIPNNMICWSSLGFEGLSIDAKSSLQNTIVGDKPPDEEKVCLGLITSALHCSRFSLNCGGYGFQYAHEDLLLQGMFPNNNAVSLVVLIVSKIKGLVLWLLRYVWLLVRLVCSISLIAITLILMVFAVIAIKPKEKGG